nr:MAG TPA: hypothetical protein [Caudoviricetes sp.]
MTKFLNKRNLYIGSFSFLYVIVAVVSLIHSFSFFGLANTTIMSVLLGIAFEIGQAVVLFSILSTKKEQSKVVPWVLMTVLTIVQVMGNIFASYKYIVTNSVADLQYFKDPIFIWTNLPDKMTTVIVTYIVGAILPIIALLMTSTLADFINGSDASLESPDDNTDITGTVNVNTNDVDLLDTPTDDKSVNKVNSISTDNVVYTPDSEVVDGTGTVNVNDTNTDTTSTDSEVVDVENKPEPNRFINI